MTRDAAIIVAAGRGSRAGGALPKQWQPLAGRRVADWSVAALRDAGLSPIVVVLHPDEMAVGGLPDDVIRVAGGATRDASVRAGMEALAPHAPDNVLIHDVARPCIPLAVINAVRGALERHEGAAPGLAVTDALWTGTGDVVTGTHPREGLFRAQTPQGFRFAPLLAAHRAHPGGAADDVAVARAAGIAVAIVPGAEDNLKITHAEDFARAERIMGGSMDATIRMGNGFDVHAFCDGDHVWLCGAKVPHERGLTGHSDADVGMHALTDAIYGALADGDIGQHFPPSDPQWKGAESHIFLRHAVSRAADRGYRIGNVDVTLICEAPKVGPHAQAMRAALAEIMGIDAGQVSVKATTSEKLGFTGRKEGIAAQATALLVLA